MTDDILKEIKSHIENASELISDAAFEGANIVLYTKDKQFFLDDKGLIRSIVNMIKKRIELRPDPSIVMHPDQAEKIIKEIISEEAGIGQILFEPERSVVIVEVEKPGIAIGKGGDLLYQIKEQTLWVPTIRRTPAIPNPLIDSIRSVLYEHSDQRRDFLHKTGKRIYNGWLRKKKEEWIRISYLGSGRQVGRTCLLLQTPESRILMDCGMDVSSFDDDAYPLLEAPEFKIQDIDAIIVSHAHVDHTALIPYLIKFGYKGPIYCTAPTRDLMALQQLDIVKIQRSEGKEPMFTSEEVKQMVLQTITLNYDEVADITPDVRITLYNSGHILGGAMIHLHVGNGLHNILYTGDLKYARTMVLNPAVTKFPRLETLMIEATYGGKDNVQPPPVEADNLLKNIIHETISRKGKVLMPVLGSGRAQEMIVLLANMIRNGDIPKDIPIYVDGMVWDITAVHTAYPEFLNVQLRKQIFHKDENPFLIENIKRVGSAKERQQIIEGSEPCVILATSGMLVGGASVEYLKGLAEQKKNSLVFSSYLGPGTLGRRIFNGEKEIGFRNGNKQEILMINLEVHKLEITGHADRKELMNFVARLNPKPRKVIVNHGESSRCLDLASSIHKQFRIETVCPRNLDAIRLK